MEINTLFSVCGAKEDIQLSLHLPMNNTRISISDKLTLNKWRERKVKLIYTYKNNIYIIYIQVILRESIHECVLSDKNMHMLFHAQAVYGRDTKIEKSLFNKCGYCNHVALPFLGRVWDNVSLVQRAEAKEVEN